GQPLATAKKEAAARPDGGEAAKAVQEAATKVVEKVIKVPVREKLPRNRRSSTFEFRVADCKGFVTVGEYDDGRPGEIFLRVSKQGSTLAGIRSEERRVGKEGGGRGSDRLGEKCRS